MFDEEKIDQFEDTATSLRNIVFQMLYEGRKVESIRTTLVNCENIPKEQAEKVRQIQMIVYFGDSTLELDNLERAYTWFSYTDSFGC